MAEPTASAPVDVDELRRFGVGITRQVPYHHWQQRSALVTAAADEIVALRAEVAAFRRAVIDRDGPSCEDVCMRSCIGVCGV